MQNIESMNSPNLSTADILASADYQTEKNPFNFDDFVVETDGDEKTELVSQAGEIGKTIIEATKEIKEKNEKENGSADDGGGKPLGAIKTDGELVELENNSKEVIDILLNNETNDEIDLSDSLINHLSKYEQA
jgi:hypothetical protein